VRGGCAALGVPLPVALPVAPRGSVTVGEGDTVVLPERVVEGVPDAVPVGVGVPEPVGVGVALCVADALTLADRVGEADREAPLLRDAVGDSEAVLLALSVDEGVGCGVRVPLPVGVGVALAVALPLSEVEPVLDGLAPAGSDVVGEADKVELPLSAEDGDAMGLPRWGSPCRWAWGLPWAAGCAWATRCPTRSGSPSQRATRRATGWPWGSPTWWRGRLRWGRACRCPWPRRWRSRCP